MFSGGGEKGYIANIWVKSIEEGTTSFLGPMNDGNTSYKWPKSQSYFMKKCFIRNCRIGLKNLGSQFDLDLGRKTRVFA